MPIQSPYTTQLNPLEERQFLQWTLANHIPWQDTLNADYDMRGYWKAQQAGNPIAQQAENAHFPDTWKTPLHSTFSNESQYATPAAPHWNEKDQLINNRGGMVADESPSVGRILGIGQPKQPANRTEAAQLEIAKHLRQKTK